MSKPKRDAPDRELLAIIETAWDEGCPVASDAHKTAEVALRRWRSLARRSANQLDREECIRDLTKGLVQAFETDPSLVGPLKKDYEHLASRIVDLLAARDRGVA